MPKASAKNWTLNIFFLLINISMSSSQGVKTLGVDFTLSSQEGGVSTELLHKRMFLGLSLINTTIKSSFCLFILVYLKQFYGMLLDQHGFWVTQVIFVNWLRFIFVWLSYPFISVLGLDILLMYKQS